MNKDTNHNMRQTANSDPELLQQLCCNKGRGARIAKREGEFTSSCFPITKQAVCVSSVFCPLLNMCVCVFIVSKAKPSSKAKFPSSSFFGNFLNRGQETLRRSAGLRGREDCGEEGWVREALYRCCFASVCC